MDLVYENTTISFAVRLRIDRVDMVMRPIRLRFEFCLTAYSYPLLCDTSWSGSTEGRLCDLS